MQTRPTDIPKFDGQEDANVFHREPSVMEDLTTKAAYHMGAMAAVHLVGVRLMNWCFDNNMPEKTHNEMMAIVLSLQEEIGGPSEEDKAEAGL